MAFAVEPSGTKDFGPCPCCGSTGRRVWGSVRSAGEPVAVYFLDWVVGRADHDSNLDLVIGRWGNGTSAYDRSIISLVYRGAGFEVIDAATRPVSDMGFAARSLSAADIIGTPIAKHAYDILDAIVAQDVRVVDVFEPPKK